MLTCLDLHRITSIEVSPSPNGPMKMDFGTFDIHYIVLTNSEGQTFRITAYSVADAKVDVVVDQPANA